jgi:mRNA interferase MazF
VPKIAVWPGDVTISDLAAAGLPAASIVRPANIATIEARDAERLGALPASDRTPVAIYLADRFGTVLKSAAAT